MASVQIVFISQLEFEMGSGQIAIAEIKMFPLAALTFRTDGVDAIGRFLIRQH